nr:15921_t:CDS:2 [Entrophospora candida]
MSSTIQNILQESQSENSQWITDLPDPELKETTGSPDFHSAKTSIASTPTTDYFPDSDEEMYDDEPSDLPAIPINYNRGRRTSVSAESMAPSEDKDYVKIVVPKAEQQRQRIEASIANNFLFKNLDEEQYKDVIDAMAEKRVYRGEEIIKQGGIGDFFYVVEIGSFDVYVSKCGAPPEQVTQYGPGGSFGELALMYNAPRAATVIATSDSVLWALDRVTFRRILMENTSRKRRMYESFLEEVPLLMSLESYERHKIADALESLYYEDGELVIEQGDIGNNFYLIEFGDARVTKFDDDGIEHELPGLKKGDYFGELALLNNKPRAVNIRAKGRLKVATLGKKAFVRLLGPVVDILKRNGDNYETITQHSPELEIDQLRTERAKKRYVSEFLSSELTALSLQNDEDCKVDIMDIEIDPIDPKNVSSSPPRRKHVVMLPLEIKRSIKKIPKELLIPISDNPIRTLVLYQPSPWLPLESNESNESNESSDQMNVEIVENIKEVNIIKDDHDVNNKKEEMEFSIYTLREILSTTGSTESTIKAMTSLHAKLYLNKALTTRSQKERETLH